MPAVRGKVDVIRRIHSDMLCRAKHKFYGSVLLLGRFETESDKQQACDDQGNSEETVVCIQACWCRS